MSQESTTKYTLEQFQVELKALLMKAVNAGLDTDDIGMIAEETLQGEWE